MLVLSHDDPRWLRLTERDDNASIYHLPAWSRLMAECYGYRPQVWAIEGERGELGAGLPVVEIPWRPGRGRFVSLPFSDYVPVLAVDEPSRRTLLDTLVARHSTSASPPLYLHSPLDLLSSSVVTGPRYLRHEVAIDPDPVATMARFNRTRVRQPLERALASNLRIIQAHGVDDYYRLHLRTRRRHGAIPQPWRFFDLLNQVVIRQGYGMVLLALHGSEVIAGSIFVWYRARIEYKYNASNPSYWSHSPNHLLLWHAIMRSPDLGCRLLDLGRTDTAAQGLRDFKASWGGEESTLAYAAIGAGWGVRRGPASKWMASVARHAPSNLLALLGRLLYKRFG